MAGRKSDFTLPTLDDLFSTQELRDDAKLSKIRDIPLELIDDFPDHPFKVRDDEDMIQLVESIKERGVITPATVRQKEDGRYELISGHRRKRACELAGFEALRCEVVDLDRDAATVLMVESNYQRSQILPSEKAFAYKMRLEAMKRQGQRSDLTLSPVGTKFDRSSEAITEETGDSRNQIHRYIRLTNLVQELLDLVDEGKIKMRPAVELSYLDEDSQRAVVDEIDLNQCTPSHDQTIRMRKFFTEGKLTPEVVSAIMSEEKPNQREKIVLRGDKVRSLIPKNDQEYTQKNKGRSKDAEEALARGVMLIFSDFGKCKDGDPALPEAQALVKRLQAYISENYYQCTPEILQTLGAMYGAGGEFTENIDKAGGEGSRVEWCACFVSWCADQCGYIDTGVVPKYAGCVNGVQWFKDRGQWIDGAAEPVPGMIIFFDWDNKGSSGPQDGQSDHTGIVQKVENGIVYTVEGNSGDSCRVNQYSVGHYEILGYGVPQY